MIVDASARVALIDRDPGWERLVEALDRAPYPAVMAPTLTETAIVLASRGVAPAVLPALLAALLAAASIDVLAFGPDHALEAAAAFRRFGKGRHPAAPTYGDCLTYAGARIADAPLLFVGDDLARTHARPALS